MQLGVAFILVNELKSGSFKWDFQESPLKDADSSEAVLLSPAFSWSLVVTAGAPAATLDGELTERMEASAEDDGAER